MLARPPRKPSYFSRVTAWFRRKLFRQPTFEDIITKFETEAKKPTPTPDWTAAVARARGRTKSVNPFALPEFPPEAMPSKDSCMAMDDFGGMGWGSQWHLAAFQSIFNEGLAFPGYAHLAQLAQRAENRKFAEILATEMTRKWIRLQSAGDDPKTDKIKKIEDGLDRLRARDVIARCIELDELFGRSHLYIDTGATDDRDELRTSLGNGRDLVSKMKVGKDGIKALRPVEPVWIYPTRYDSNDPLQPNWYEPTTWFVMGKEVHATRLLKFVGRVVPDLLKPAYSFGGLSMSQLATPYVENWLRTRQSVSDLIHAFSVFVLKTDLGASLVEGAELLFKRLELFNLLRDNRGLMMVNKETEDLANVSAPLGGLHELQAQAQEQMASVASIPVVKLLGIQPTGLNASDEGGIRMFYDWILSQQEKRLRPHLTTVIDFIMLSEFGEVDQEINFKFVPLYSLDEKAEAELKKTEADMDATYIDAGVLSPVEVREAVANDSESRYSSIDVEDVPDLREEEEQGLVPEGGGRTTAELAGGEAEKQGEVPPGAINKGGGGGGPGGKPGGGGGGPGGKPGGGLGGLPKGKLGGPSGGQEEDMDLGGDPDEIEENLTPFEQRVRDRADRHVRGEGEFYDRARGWAERHHKEPSPEYAERRARGDFRERLGQRAERHERGEGPFYERARARTGEGRLNPDYLKQRRLGHDGPFAADDWEESKHPRGQPGNAGQFGPGGSSVGEGTLENSPSSVTMAGRSDEVLFNARAVAEKHGFDPEKVSVSEEIKTFKLGDVEYKYAGSANLNDGTVTLYPKVIRPGTTIGIAVHEVMHQKWETVFKAYVKEGDAASKASSEADWRLDAPMKPDGSLREGAEKEYPLYAKIYPLLEETSKLAKDDGVTEYSKQYWKLWHEGKMRTDLAFHETLAEMARLHQETGDIPGTGRWKKLYKAVLSTYPKVKS